MEPGCMKITHRTRRQNRMTAGVWDLPDGITGQLGHLKSYRDFWHLKNQSPSLFKPG